MAMRRVLDEYLPAVQKTYTRMALAQNAAADAQQRAMEAGRYLQRCSEVHDDAVQQLVTAVRAMADQEGETAAAGDRGRGRDRRPPADARAGAAPTALAAATA